MPGAEVRTVVSCVVTSMFDPPFSCDQDETRFVLLRAILMADGHSRVCLPGWKSPTGPHQEEERGKGMAFGVTFDPGPGVLAGSRSNNHPGAVR
jgi:hypothetical protein